MENFLWLFSKLAMALVLLVAIFNKTDSSLFELNSSASSTSQKVLRVFEQLHRPISLFLIFGLLNTGTTWLSIFAASIQLGILVTNKVLKRMNIIDQCNCYGSSLKNNSKLEMVLDGILFFCCISIITLGVTSKTNGFIENYFFSGDLFVIAFAIATTLYVGIKKFNSLKVPAKDNRNETNSKIHPVKRIFSSSMLIGKNEVGQEMNLEHIAESKSLLLFIGLSSSCPSCEYAKPDLVNLADSFNSKIQTIFIFDEHVTALPQLNGSIAIKGTEFTKFIKPEGYPFALIINPDNFSQIGNVAYTVKNIWMLFYFAIGLLEPVKE